MEGQGVRTVLCFGNELVEQDSLALQLAKELKVEGFEFVACSSPEEILNHDDALVMDVAEGVKDVTLIEDVSRLIANPVAMHDLDLGFFLKLSKELGELRNVKIVALPQKGEKERIKAQVIDVLRAV